MGSPARLSPDRMYPAGRAHLSARQVRLVSGESLRVIEGGPAGQRPVVLIHGWGGSAYSFAEIIDALVAEGRRAFAVDLPGHGLSEPFRDPARNTIHSVADAVFEVLAASGVSHCALVAHSMGGAVALDMACRAEAPIDRLVLAAAVGTGHVPLAPVARTLATRTALALVTRLGSRAMVRFVLRHLVFATSERPTEQDVDEYWAPTQFPHMAGTCREFLHRVDWGLASPRTLASLRVPVLVIAGGRDRVVRGADRGGRLIPGARVVVVDDAGHLVVQERAAICVAAIRDFLTSPG